MVLHLLLLSGGDFSIPQYLLQTFWVERFANRHPLSSTPSGVSSQRSVLLIGTLYVTFFGLQAGPVTCSLCPASCFPYNWFY